MSGESSRKMCPVDILPLGSLPSFAMHFVSFRLYTHAFASSLTDVSACGCYVKLPSRIESDLSSSILLMTLKG
jgi:hypothetical protein